MVLCRAGDDVAIVCNPIRMCIWSELMVLCVCHWEEVMIEAEAKDTYGELGSAFPGSLVGESVFRTAKLEMLIESAYTLVMSNSVLSIAMLMVSSSKWGSFFYVVDSGLRMKLTELWITKTVSLILGLGVDPVVLGCSSGCWNLLIVP